MATLTPAQKTTLKNHVAANTNTVSVNGGTPVAINTLPINGDTLQVIAAWYNLTAAPEYRVWRHDVSVSEILDKVNYTNFTPNDDPNQSTATLAQVWENRAMLIQIKQRNLQLLLQGLERFNATKGTLRNGLQDCTESLPSGNNGNARNGGWTNIQPVLSRPVTNAERLYSTGTGSTAVPGTLDADFGGTFTLSPLDLQDAINNG